MKKTLFAALILITAMVSGIITAGAETALPRENLALDADVEADNSFENNQYFSTVYLTDGVHVPLDEDLHAGWSIDPFSVIPRDEPVNVTVDLGRSYMLDTVVIRPCLYNNGEKMPSCFEVQISDDYKTWTAVAKVEDLVLEAADDQIYTFEPVRARFVRIAITKHSDKVDPTGSYLSEFSELEVYGEALPATEKPTEAPTPEPTEAPEETPVPTAVPAATETEDAREDNDKSDSGKGIIIAIIAVCAVAAAIACVFVFTRRKK